MFTTKNLNVLIFVALTSTFFVKEIHTCFTYNETHKTTILRSGSSFYQECVCEEPVLSTHNLKWLDASGNEILAGPGSREKVYTERGHHVLSLIIPNASKSLSGTYKCVSKGQDDREYAITYNIDVYEPLYFLPANITPQFLINGQDSLIRCQARGHKTPRITWYKGQEEVLINDSEKYEIQPEGLLIKNPSREDASEYYCTARVPYTSEDVNTIIQVEVMTPPAVKDVIAILDDVVTEGEPLTIDCKASGYPLPTYFWRKIDDQNSTEQNVTWQQDLNKIMFENVTMDDHGIYECIAQNKAGESRKNISIEVLVPPTITEFVNITAAEGSPVSIVCGAMGRPQPYINITYFGPLLESPGYETINEDPTYMAVNLTFEKVQRFHEGYYDCNASNVVGSEIKSMYLMVMHKPIFEQPEEIVWSWEDSTVNLSCEHISNPPATLEWRFQGNTNMKPSPEQIEVNQFWMSKLSKTTEDYITFKPIKRFLYGTYECIARNHLGDARKIIRVKEGFKPPKLSHEQINITDVAATSVTFDLEDPKYEGPPLIGFTAEYDEAEKYNETHIHLNRTWATNVPYKIGNLSPMKTYYIRFAAINSMGNGPFGDYLSFETPAKSVPEPPSWDYDSEPVPIPANNRILKLKSPEHNGDTIDYYAIKYCPVNKTDECIEQKISPTAELQLHHLSHNTSYRLDMVAHNSVGNSTPVSLEIFIAESNILEEEMALSELSNAVITGISIVVLILCLLVLDVIFLVTKKKGMIASCAYKKNKKKMKEETAQSKDKKGLLKDSAETGDTMKRPDNGHKEFEYNKSTGIITGKHSAV